MEEELPTWKDLEGEYLRGVMPSNGYEEEARVWLFFDDYALALRSINKDYSWHDNWGIFDQLNRDEWPERDDTYKTVGMKIQTVWTDGYDTDQHNIAADMEKWVEAVGEGYWGAKEGKQYTFIELQTPLKTIEFGTVYWDCHYPSTVWDVIEEDRDT